MDLQIPPLVGKIPRRTTHDCGGHIRAFTGLRGVMAWWVVLGHIGLTVGPPEPGWVLVIWRFLAGNTLAVDVFIILSGFVIARLIDLRREPYGRYILRRACRLFPLYLTVLILSACLLPMILSAVTETPLPSPRNADRAAQARIALADLWPHMAVHLPLMQGVVPQHLLPQAAYTIVGQAWSVSLEWQFYLIAPLCLLATRDLRRLAGLGAVLIALGLLSGLGPAFIGQSWPLFAVGIGTYLWARDANGKTAVGLSALALITLAYRGPMAGVPLTIWGLTCVSALGDDRLTWLRRGLSSRWLCWLGDRSYSTYLVHMLPLYLLMFGMNRLGLGAAAQGPVLWVGTVVLSVLASMLCYRFIEQPGIALGRRAGQPAPRPA